MIIAEKESSSQYQLFGRAEQLEKVDHFVRNALTTKTQQRILIRGEYGTGKTHHLFRLRDEINNGKYEDGAVAIYMGNLGISVRRFYEVFAESLRAQVPELDEYIRSLPKAEPEDSADPAYKKEKLRDNVIGNIAKTIVQAQMIGHQAIFLLIDEAEDIVQSNDNDEIQYFIQSLVHLVNELQGYPLHIIMGFSREALLKISTFDEDEPRERRLGDAFFQRFSSKEEIVLGYLTENDAKAMILDRLNNARMVPNSEFYPIHEGVISVVSSITGGHPREILTIINKGIENAMKSGSREVDGICIIQVLATHTLFFNKKIVLDWSRLAEITAWIGEEDEGLKIDFERLRGKLIGENGSVTIDDFSDRRFPDMLIRPIHGVRVLERKDSGYGETYYVAHQDLKGEVFKGKRYDSQTEQVLDREIIDLLHNPERYQKQLTSGFWRLLQEEWKAELKTNETFDQHQIIVGKVRLENSSSPVSVAFSAYKGGEFPTKLYQKTLDILEKKVSHFGCILYDGPRFEIEPLYKSFLNEVRDQDRKRLFDNVCSIHVNDISSENRQLMGMIKLLGNREVEVTDTIDTAGLFQDIGVTEKVTDLVNERAITYPEDDLIRRVINTLAAKPLNVFSISDLKAALETQYVNKNLMERLEKQRFVLKDGKGWNIAPLTLDPPWKPFYSLISEHEGVGFDQIKEFLEERYILQCPPSDEGHMVSWYLDLLLNQNMIVVDSHGGKQVYRLMDHSGKLESLLQTSEERLTELKQLIGQAEQLQIPVSDFITKRDVYAATIERLAERFEVGSKEVTECQDLIDRIRDANTDLSRDVSAKSREFTSLVENKRQIAEAFEAEIERAFSEGYISEIEREEWSVQISSIYDTLKVNHQNKRYSLVTLASKDLTDQVLKYRKQIEERKNSKEPCIEYAMKYQLVSSECDTVLVDLENLGYDASDTKEKLASLEDHYMDDYTEEFNSGKYDAAKACITTIYSKAQAILHSLNQTRNSYNGYDQRIAKANALAKDDGELTSILKAAADALQDWNFALVEMKLKEFDDLRAKKTEVPKTPEDIFIETFARYGSVSFQEILKKYSHDEAFDIVKNLYLAGKIKSIDLRLR